MMNFHRTLLNGIKAWAENEFGACSWNDLEDKPFDNVVEDGYIIPEKTVAVQIMNEDEGLRGFVLTEKPNAIPTAGKTYTVNWNGTAYECEMYETDPNHSNERAFGNVGVLGMGELNDIPFVGLLHDSRVTEYDAYAEIIVLDGSDTVTFSIYGEMEYTKQLDPVFLPEDYINSLIDAKIAAIPSAEEASF